MYVVAGTQAQHASQNYLSLMQLSDINQGRHGSNANNDSDDDMSDDEDKDRPPQIHTNKIAHHGGVNRLRCMPQQPTIVASWGDTGLVQVTLQAVFGLHPSSSGLRIICCCQLVHVCFSQHVSHSHTSISSHLFTWFTREQYDN